MLSRDFVYAFLLGQVQGGATDVEAKQNFQDWLKQQTDAVATAAEKQSIVSDLGSYSILKK